MPDAEKETLMEDFTKEFSAQRAMFRPWAILVVFNALAIIIGLPLVYFLLDPGETVIGVIGGVIVLVFLATIVPFIKASKCPACHNFMGREQGRFCPLCGVQIQE